MERVFGAITMDHPDIWWISKYQIHYKIKPSNTDNIDDTNTKTNTNNDNDNDNNTDNNDKNDNNNNNNENEIRLRYRSSAYPKKIKAYSRLNRGKDHYDSQNNINIYKSNSHNRLYYVNATTIRLNYEDEQSSGNRRIKKKRREIKERNKINIEEDNDDNDDNYLSKIQLQLCSSPKDNICNTYTINDINRMNGLIEKKIQDILSNAKLYFEKKKNQNNDSDDSNSSSSSSSNISNSNKDKTLSNNKDVKITEYEFIKYIHDLLIKNIEYGFSDNDFTEYTIYGALIEHRCVCEGFSEAFMILAQRVKIFTILATSNTHQWNMVFLEGKWYALDVTWDIPNYSSLSIINKHKEVGRLKKKRNTISSSDIQTNDGNFFFFFLIYFYKNFNLY